MTKSKERMEKKKVEEWQAKWGVFVFQQLQCIYSGMSVMYVTCWRTTDFVGSPWKQTPREILAMQSSSQSCDI